MNKRSILKLAAIALFFHGFFEVMGLMAALAPADAMPETFEQQTLFWGLISFLFGLTRLIAGVSIWRGQKWGIALGIVLSLTAFILAPDIDPFGVLDLALAIVVMVSLLRVLFWEEKIAL